MNCNDYRVLNFPVFFPEMNKGGMCSILILVGLSISESSTFATEKETDEVVLRQTGDITPILPVQWTKSVFYGNTLALAGFGLGVSGLVDKINEIKEDLNQASVKTLLDKTEEGFRTVERDLDYINKAITAEKLQKYYQIERNVIGAMNELKHDTFSSKTLGLELHGDLVFFMEGMLGQNIIAADILAVIATLENVCS